MKIARNTFAVFWSRKGWRMQFHADIAKAIHGTTPQAAAQAFRDMFPKDTVMSVRDTSGRFLAFK